MEASLVIQLRMSLLHALCLMIALLGSQTLSAQTSVLHQQNMVKSVFLLNVAKFVEWPELVYESRPTQLVLCQYQNDLLGLGFEIIRNRSVNGRRIEKRTVPELQHLESCDLLYLAADQYSAFVSSDTAKTLNGLLVVVDRTQSEIGRTENGLGAYPGVHVTLFRDQEKIAFAVNLQEATRSNLKFSSELLKLSKIVGRR